MYLFMLGLKLNHVSKRGLRKTPHILPSWVNFMRCLLWGFGRTFTALYCHQTVKGALYMVHLSCQVHVAPTVFRVFLDRKVSQVVPLARVKRVTQAYLVCLVALETPAVMDSLAWLDLRVTLAYLDVGYQDSKVFLEILDRTASRVTLECQDRRARTVSQDSLGARESRWVMITDLDCYTVVAIGLSVGYEVWPPDGWHHPFVMGWSKDRLGLPSAHCIMGSHNHWEFPLFFRAQWQSFPLH